MKKENNSRKSIWYTLTKRATKEQYNKKIEELSKKGIELSREEKSKLRHKYAQNNARKAKFRTTMLAILGAGVIGGFAANNALNPGIEGVTQNKNGIVVDLDEVDKDIKFEGNKRQQFLERLAQETIDNELESNTEQEINNLKTPEAVLEYIKEIYVSEYNKNNEEKISIDNVSFSKNTHDIVIYDDKAENGDEILRYCSEGYAERNGIRKDGDKSIITAYVINGDEKKVERIACDNKGEFQNVYSANQEVAEDSNTTLVNVGEIVLAGIDMSTSLEQGDNNSWQVNRQYKQKLIDAVKEYKNEQIEEIVTGENKTQHQQETDGFEPGD